MCQRVHACMSESVSEPCVQSTASSLDILRCSAAPWGSPPQTRSSSCTRNRGDRCTYSSTTSLQHTTNSSTSSAGVQPIRAAFLHSHVYLMKRTWRHTTCSSLGRLQHSPLPSSVTLGLSCHSTSKQTNKQTNASKAARSVFN